MREATIEGKLVEGLRARGWLALKFISPGNDGVPDRLAIGPGGRIIFVELKTERGIVSPMQRRQIDRLRARGADVRVLKGLEAVREFIEEVAGCTTS